MELARHFGLTQEGVLAVVLLALQPSEVVQVTSVKSSWIFGNLRKAGAELSAQRATAESSLLLLADLPLPGSFSFGFTFVSIFHRSCCCSRAPPPPSTLRAGLSTGLTALETLIAKMVGFEAAKDLTPLEFSTKS